MAVCGNCKTKLTCGCQRTTARDGKKVCTNCVQSYNQQLEVKKRTSSTPPTQVKANYNGPGQQV